MPIFCVKSVKIYTSQKKFTRVYSWLSWQISGMDPRKKSVKMKKKIQISGATYSAKFFHKPLVCEGLWKIAVNRLYFWIWFILTMRVLSGQPTPFQALRMTIKTTEYLCANGRGSLSLSELLLQKLKWSLPFPSPFLIEKVIHGINAFQFFSAATLTQYSFFS